MYVMTVTGMDVAYMGEGVCRMRDWLHVSLLMSSSMRGWWFSHVGCM